MCRNDNARSSQSGFALLPIIGLVAVVAVVGLAVWQARQHSTSSLVSSKTTPTSTPLPTVTPSPTPRPADSADTLSARRKSPVLMAKRTSYMVRQLVKITPHLRR
ncbi:hypothetical protein IPG36_06175 [bacterium]|nr:MAG: hypothetical protein IPG36_06175 [bacterium]